MVVHVGIEHVEDLMSILDEQSLSLLTTPTLIARHITSRWGEIGP
jgi:hypothetical protein